MTVRIVIIRKTKIENLEEVKCKMKKKLNQEFPCSFEYK